VITITPDEYRLKGEVTTWDRVEAAIAETPVTASFTIIAAPDTPFERVRKVLTALKDRGVRDVTFGVIPDDGSATSE